MTLHLSTVRPVIGIIILTVTTLLTGCSTHGTSSTVKNGTNSTDTLSSQKLIAASTPLSNAIEIQSWETEKNAKVLFVESREIPLVDIRLVFNAGSAQDGNLPGLAAMTNAMLDEGTDNYSVDDIARQFEGLGAVFGKSSHRDMAILQLRTLSENDMLNGSLKVLLEILSASTFPAKNVERVRSQLLFSLQQEKQSPGAILRKDFYKALYGNFPYGSASRGTFESLEKITIEDLKTFYKKRYVASNLVIALTGDLSRSQAETITSQIDAHLARGIPPEPLGTPAPLKQAITEKIEYPSAQTHILAGALGIKQGDPDFFALYTGNEILGGGGFSSLLNKVIRQENGLAYSVYSYFSPMAVAGPFLMGLQTRNDQAPKALALLQDTLKTFITQGPTEEQLTEVKKNITGSFPLSIDSNSNILGYLGMIGFYGLPLDYLDTYNQNIMAVTTSQIKAAFRKHLDPQKLLIVSVGDHGE